MSTTDQTTNPIVEPLSVPDDQPDQEPRIWLDLDLSESEALRAWLLKPAKDGTTSLDDPLVSRALTKLNPEFRPPLDTVAQYEKRLAAGHPEEAAEYFMAEVVRMPPDFVAWVKSQPFFADSVNVAHTLPYDGRVMGDYLIPTELAGRVAAPTLVLAGGADFPFMPETAQAIATAIPNARYVHVEGQGHAVEPAAIAPLLREFFAE